MKWQILIDNQPDKDMEREWCENSQRVDYDSYSHLVCGDYRSNLKWVSKPTSDSAGLIARYAVEFWHLGSIELGEAELFARDKNGNDSPLGFRVFLDDRMGEYEIRVPWNVLARVGPDAVQLHFKLSMISPYSERNQSDNYLWVDLPNLTVNSITRRTPGADGTLSVNYHAALGNARLSGRAILAVYWLMSSGEERTIEKRYVQIPGADGDYVEKVDAGRFQRPPDGAIAILARFTPDERLIEKDLQDNTGREDFPDYYILDARWTENGGATIDYFVTKFSTLHDIQPVIRASWVNEKESIIKSVAWEPPVEKAEGRHSYTFGKSLGIPPRAAVGMRFSLDAGNKVRESNESNNTTNIPLEDLSAEIEDAPPAPTREQRMVLWCQQNRAKIQSAANKWNIRPEAIAGAVMWEATQYRHPFRAYGPGKVHFDRDMTSIWGIPWPGNRSASVTIEKMGWMPPRATVEDRRLLLKKTGHALDYIGGIMNAYAYEAELGGYSFRSGKISDIALMTMFYNGFESKFSGRPANLQQLVEENFFALKNGEPLILTVGHMPSWVLANGPLLRRAVHGIRFRPKKVHPPANYPAPYVRGPAIIPETAAAGGTGYDFGVEALLEATPDDMIFTNEQSEVEISSTNGQIVVNWCGAPDTWLQRKESGQNGNWTDIPETRGLSEFVQPATGPGSLFRVVTDLEQQEPTPASLDPDDYLDEPSVSALPAQLDVETLDGHAALNPVLSWEAVPAATGYSLALYMDGTNRLVGVFDIAGTTNSIISFIPPVALLPNRQYYFHVCVVNGVGRGDWSDFRRFTTEDDAIPGPPILVMPPRDDTDLPVNLKLDWNSVPGATGYDWQLYQGSQLVAEGGPIADTSVRVSLRYAVEYRWRVRSRVLPQENPWSEFWKFTTIDDPGVFALISPTDGAVLADNHVRLDWQSVRGADGYDVRLFKNGEQVKIEGPMAHSSAAFVLEPNTRYTWQYRARVLENNNPWSPAYSFTTGAKIDLSQLPALTSPSNGANNIEARATIVWREVESADGYDWEVYDGDTKVAGFGISYPGPYRGTSVTVPLEYGKTYKWRARARVLPQNNPWTVFWSFTTKPVPVARLVSPADQATDRPTQVTLDWASVPEADGYDWELYTGGNKTAGFGISYEGPYMATSVAVNLDCGRTYQWRARARVISQNNPWSPMWTFSTRMSPSVPPVTGAPGCDSVNVSRSPSFSWSVVPRADQYRVQLAADVPDEAHVVDHRTMVVAGTGYAIAAEDPLRQNREYYWRVRAENCAGNSPWSTWCHFHTINTRPEQVVGLAGCGSVNVSRWPTVSWAAADGATSYVVQFAADAPSEANVVERRTATTTGTSHTIPDNDPLSATRTFYWRVQGVNNLGAGPWSSWCMFSTTSASAPTGVSPINTSNVSRTPTITWNIARGAKSYDVDIAADAPSDANIVARRSANVTGTMTTIPSTDPLSSSRTFYWRVRAHDTSEISPWSIWYQFRTNP